AKEWQQKQNLKDARVNREKYLHKINGIVYGEDPRQGYREDDVFYHPQLKFQFSTPPGWQYINTPSQVQLADKNGKAMILMTLAKGTDPQEAANNFVQQNQLQVHDGKQLSVNGLQAVAILADTPSQPSQQQLQTWSYFIQYG